MVHLLITACKIPFAVYRKEHKPFIGKEADMNGLILEPRGSSIECGVLCFWRILVKRIALIFIILLFIMFPVSVFAILQGDIDNSGDINLKEALAAINQV